MTGRIATVAAAAVLIAGCAGPHAPPPPRTAQATRVPAAPTADSPSPGVVVAGSPIAADIGGRVLAEGGNAVDAAVATAFALAVVEPTMSGIGGRSQLLIRTAAGDVVGLDGTTEVPAAYPAGREADEDAYGYGTIGIPGTVAVLAAALERHGTWPLARVLEPAIRVAEQGFRLPPEEAARVENAADALRQFDGSRALFLRPDGSTYDAGDLFRQPALAATLRRVARGGARAFYTGDVARLIDADMRAHGGWLRAEDLASYQAEEALVVRGDYRGHELIGTYLPASGATTIEALQVLEHFDLDGLDDAAWIDVVAQALLLAFDDRVADLGTPEEQAGIVTSPERARELAARITVRAPAAGGAASSRDREPPHTTHLSVVDGRGMAVALTQSVGPNLGSKVAAPGLGFIYAATMGYLGDLRPGERPWSSQSPLIVLRDGELRYVLGGAGARRIISALVQTLTRAIDEDLPLERALALPRFHVSGDAIYLERRPGAAWSEAVEDRLRELGWDVRPRDDAGYFARLNAIEVAPRAGTVEGLPDPRWPGGTASPR